MTTLTIVLGFIGLVSAILGTTMSSVAAEQTNYTNRKIAEETNETSLEAMREQTASDQAYNSMSAQMMRSMAAGVNPILAAGAQPTSVSSKSVPNLHSPQLQNPLADLADFGPSVSQVMNNTGSNFVDAKLRSEQLNLNENQLKLEDFQTRVNLLKTIGEIGGSNDWTSQEMTRVINSVMGDKYDANTLGSFQRDQAIVTKIQNTIEQSNIDTNTKKYLYGWLDEFTIAQYGNIVEDTNLKQWQSKVASSVSKMNDSQRKVYDQELKNLQEEWKSLNFQGQLDVKKLEHVAKLADAFVRKFHYESGLSEMEFKNYIYSLMVKSTPAGAVSSVDAILSGGRVFPDLNF